MLSRYQDTIFELLRADGYVTVSKPLISVIGFLEAGVYSELVSRHFYFAEKNQLTEDGYFFNTVEDFELMSRLTAYQQRAVFLRLKELNLIDFEVRGLPAKRYFKINRDPDVLLQLLEVGRNRLEKRKEIHSLSKTSQLETEKLHGNKRYAPETDFTPEHELGILTAVGHSIRRHPRGTWGQR